MRVGRQSRALPALFRRHSQCHFHQSFPVLHSSVELTVAGIYVACGMIGGLLMGQLWSSPKDPALEQCLRESRKKPETDDSGNPRFIKKLRDYIVWSDDPWDVIYAQHLFTHRRNVKADAMYTFRTDRGETGRWNAIHCCSSHPSLVGMLEWLLNEGSIDPNAPTDDEWKDTPLIRAVKTHNEPAVRMLLKDSRVIKDATDSDHRHPLIHAAINNDSELTAILLSHGCDPTHQDKFEKDALFYSKQRGYSKITEQLEQALKSGWFW